MEATKLKLIEFIINEASDNQLESLEQLLIQNDYLYGIELLNKDIIKDIKTDIKETINQALFKLSNGDIEGAKKLLQEALND